MPVEIANNFLPESARLTDVYSSVLRANWKIGKTKEEILDQDTEIISRAASDFFSAGVAYFANRGNDQYLNELGTLTWHAVNQRVVIVAYSDNIIAGALHLGLPLEYTRYVNPKEPHIQYTERPVGRGTRVSEIYALTPPEYLVRVQNNPIEALATMAMICSTSSDYVNGRVKIDPNNIQARAQATEAHFLIYAQKQTPDYRPTGFYADIIKKYPQGIHSLPSGLLYRGFSGNEFGNTKNN